jgi:hypothetical protein
VRPLPSWLSLVFVPQTVQGGACVSITHLSRATSSRPAPGCAQSVRQHQGNQQLIRNGRCMPLVLRLLFCCWELIRTGLLLSCGRRTVACLCLAGGGKACSCQPAAAPAASGTTCQQVCVSFTSTRWHLLCCVPLQGGVCPAAAPAPGQTQEQQQQWRQQQLPCHE